MPLASRQSRPLAIIGPSGCGKSSLLRLLEADGIVHITPTWTDRPKRPGEENLEHRFVSPKEFTAKAASGAFAEVVQPFSLPYRYGMPYLEATPGRLSVVMIRATYVPKFLTYYPGGVVYQIEADATFATAAVNARPGEVGSRLLEFEAEIKSGRRVSRRQFHNDGGELKLLAEELVAAMREDELLDTL